MSEIIHAGFERPSRSFIRDPTGYELIEYIADNVDLHGAAIETTTMLQSNPISGMYRVAGWRVWFCGEHHPSAIQRVDTR